MRQSEIENGTRLGSRLGRGMFAPFGDGIFLGGVRPQVPLRLRRGGHLGLFEVRPRRGRASGIVYRGGASGVVRPGRKGPIVRRLGGVGPIAC